MESTKQIFVLRVSGADGEYTPILASNTKEGLNDAFKEWKVGKGALSTWDFGRYYIDSIPYYEGELNDGVKSNSSPDSPDNKGNPQGSLPFG